MRISSQDWQNYASTSVDVFHINHGYDQDSNRKYTVSRENGTFIINFDCPDFGNSKGSGVFD